MTGSLPKLLSELQALVDRHAAMPPPLPRPRPISAIDVQAYLKGRRLRGHFFDPSLFADPAWDMLLDLWVARSTRRDVSVTSLCIASAVAPTTALRWIDKLAAMGYILHQDDPSDGRRRHVILSNSGVQSLGDYFTAMGSHGLLASDGAA